MTPALQEGAPALRKTDAARWVGYGLSWSAALFLLGASVAPKLLQVPIATDTLINLGWPVQHTRLIGVIELACVLLYLVPRTSVLGAVLATGLLGGAIATNLRAGMPLFSHTLFGVYVGVFLWGGLWLRDSALRSVFPVRR